MWTLATAQALSHQGKKLGTRCAKCEANTYDWFVGRHRFFKVYFASPFLATLVPPLGLDAFFNWHPFLVSALSLDSVFLRHSFLSAALSPDSSTSSHLIGLIFSWCLFLFTSFLLTALNLDTSLFCFFSCYHFFLTHLYTDVFTQRRFYAKMLLQTSHYTSAFAERNSSFVFSPRFFRQPRVWRFVWGI